MEIFYLIILTVITYARTLKNSFISDDITVHSEQKAKGYPVILKEFIQKPFYLIHDISWKLFKDKPLPHHILSLFLFTSIVCSFYIVASKFIPQNIAFLAALFYAVHPCNAQIGGWISGKNYTYALLIGLWALYFNSPLLYVISFLTTSIILLLPLMMDISLPIKVLSIGFACYLFYRQVKTKADVTATEGIYKKDNLIFYPRKLIIALKSFAYYFTLTMLPTKMGWFHEIGEPIDDKLKSFNFHAILSILLIGVMCLFIGKPAFIGLLIFVLFIAPFTNLITPALFTSERYMSPAIMGWSIFLAYTLVNYPILVAIIATVYFMRTQLELWAYKDDFHLALYSLLNFYNSGFAWANLANLFLYQHKPSAAFDTIHEGLKHCPEFPTLYYQLYQMYRATDLLFDFDRALENLEKACLYGKHEHWYKELENFKEALRKERIKRFLDDTRHKSISQSRARTQPNSPDLSRELSGVA